jgi:hypothetical protein
MSIEAIDMLENELDFSQEKMFELEQRIDYLETCLLHLAKVLVVVSFNQERRNSNDYIAPPMSDV